MKIATYNVRNLYDPGTFIDEKRESAVEEGFFNKRIEYITNLFRKVDADIFCLQEIGGERGVTEVANTLGYNYFFAKPNSRGIRVAVLYKKEMAGPVTCESVSLGDLVIPAINQEGDTGTLSPISKRRDILVVDMPYFNKPLRIVTFHLKSLLPEYLEGEDREQDKRAHLDAKFRSIFYKMMELRSLRVFANKSQEEGKSLVFLGDFNENNNSSGIDLLKSSLSEDGILYDVVTGFSGDRTTHIHRGNRITFDTILISQDLREQIASVEIENQGLKDYSQLPRGDIEFEVESDHAMVILTLK